MGTVQVEVPQGARTVQPPQARKDLRGQEAAVPDQGQVPVRIAVVAQSQAQALLAAHAVTTQAALPFPTAQGWFRH